MEVMNRAERRIRGIKRTFGRSLCPACDDYYKGKELWSNECQCTVDFKTVDRHGVQCDSMDLKDISEFVVIIYEEKNE